ncbi:MAG TPA: Amuc_1099 family pilus-like system protein, partial [Luteolibacter sp.]|nr:Amuc_1099 family pilus-like system protein [Luteolibacter sp.]
SALEPIGPGTLFFKDGAAANRFKFLKSTKDQQGDGYTLEIEDQSPNKKGKIYELPSPLTQAKMGQYVQYDRSAIMSLDALGLGGQSFKVEENTRFSLPPDAPQKEYLLKSVTPQAIVVESPGADGKTQEITIQKQR